MERTRQTLECNKCGKLYKLQNAYEKHLTNCVQVVSRTALQELSDSNRLDLVRVAVEPPELVIKKVRKNAKCRKTKQVVAKQGEVGVELPPQKPKQTKQKPKTLLEQADQETRWQLIQCNVNEVLNQTIGSQRCHITQQIPTSRFSKHKQSAAKWWSAAQDEPEKAIKCQSTEDVPKHAPANSSHSSCVQQAWHTANSSNGSSVQQAWHTANQQLVTSKISSALESPCTASGTVQVQVPYRDNAALMERLKVNMCTDTEPEHTKSATRCIQPQCTIAASRKEMVNNRLFSDVTVRSMDGDTIYAHKVFLSLSYLAMCTFLQCHKQIDMSSLCTIDITTWLSAVYTGDWKEAEDKLTATTIDIISQFIQHASSWKESDLSEPHIPVHRKIKKAVKSKSSNNQRNKRAPTLTCNQEGTATSTTGKESLVPAPSRDRKRKSASKAEDTRSKIRIDARTPSSKVSPLLSTIGLVAAEGADSVEAELEVRLPPQCSTTAANADLCNQPSPVERNEQGGEETDANIPETIDSTRFTSHQHNLSTNDIYGVPAGADNVPESVEGLDEYTAIISPISPHNLGTNFVHSGQCSDALQIATTETSHLDSVSVGHLESIAAEFGSEPATATSPTTPSDVHTANGETVLNHTAEGYSSDDLFDESLTDDQLMSKQLN